MENKLLIFCDVIKYMPCQLIRGSSVVGHTRFFPIIFKFFIGGCAYPVILPFEEIGPNVSRGILSYEL